MTKNREQGTRDRERDSFAAAEEVQQIFLTDLRVAEWNARKTIEPKALAELADSIGRIGLQVPLLVRILPVSAWKTLADQDVLDNSSANLYEIVAGHRRFEAMKQAGFASAPCLVREMDDARARKVGLVDNLQREDVPALEESDALAELLDDLGSVEAVAAEVGKDVAHVAKRLKLRTLGIPGRTALKERLINVDHALLLARLGTADQEAPLKWCLDRQAGSKTPVDKVIAERIARRGKKNANGYRGWHWEAETVQRLKEHIEQSSGRKLSLAPWGLEDAGLVPARGACSNCPSNTKANGFLFGDLEIEEATCADGGCFEAKRSVFVKIQLQKAGEDLGAKPPRRIAQLSWKLSSVKPKTGFNDAPHQMSMTSCADVSKVLKQGQWVEAKKGSCPDVRPGVTVDWYEEAWSNKKPRKPGETLLVCLAVGCKVHEKEWEKPKSGEQGSGGGGGGIDVKAEKEKRKEKQEAVEAENGIRAREIGLALENVSTLTGDLLRAVVLKAIPHWTNSNAQKLCPGYEKKLKTAKVESAAFARAAAFLLFATSGWVSEYTTADAGRKELVALLKMLGHDASKAWDAAKGGAQKKPSKAPAVAEPKPAKRPAKKAAAKAVAKAVAPARSSPKKKVKR